VKAAVLVGLEQVELQERPEPEPRPGWVVTHRFGLDDIAEAVADVASQSDRSLKVIVTPYPTEE